MLGPKDACGRRSRSTGSALSHLLGGYGRFFASPSTVWLVAALDIVTHSRPITRNASFGSSFHCFQCPTKSIEAWEESEEARW